MFKMDARNVIFTNSEENPIRPWFYRMIRQLERNSLTDNVDWNRTDISILMHPDQWGCTSRLYSYGNYYMMGTDESGNKYFANYTKQAQNRHEEYLARRALPIVGRFYPVILDSDMTKSTIDFTARIYLDVMGKILGRFENVNCYWTEDE